MSDQIVTAAGAAPAEGLLAPAQPTVTPAPAPAAEPAPAISDLLAQHRRARQESQKAAQETAGVRSELERVKAELAKYQGARKDIIADPVGFLRAHGVTDEELPLVGEAAFYERMPNKAPADLRARMLEARIARTERDREAALANEATAAEARDAAARIQNYRGALEASVTGEGCPLSKAWFGDDGAEEYVESLVHTARNLAHAANERGEVADLSPANVRKVLEDHLAKRAGRLPGRAAPAEQKREDQRPSFLDAPRGVSAQGAVNSGSTARAPANTEAERVRRAIAAMDALDPGPQA